MEKEYGPIRKIPIGVDSQDTLEQSNVERRQLLSRCEVCSLYSNWPEALCDGHEVKHVERVKQLEVIQKNSLLYAT